MATYRVALGRLLGIIVAVGCNGSSQTADADIPGYEIVRESVCPISETGNMQAYLIGESSIVVVCGTSTTTIYRLEENSHASTVIYRQVNGFDVQMVVGEIMYISPQIQGPELQALRLDAGPVTPHTIVESSLHGMGPLGISETYVYWAWREQQASGPMMHGLSRVLLAGGSEEDVATLPFGPSYNLTVIGEDVYALGYPTPDLSIAVAHISTVSHKAETIFSEPPGTPIAAWFGGYRDHVIWSDTSAVPPKVYQIRGSILQRDTSIRCAPNSTSVLVGDLLTSYNTGQCATHDTLVTATDLGTGEVGQYTHHADHQRVDRLVGSRNGWIYLIGANEMFRVRAEPL
jgi:hypothetical protein